MNPILVAIDFSTRSDRAVRRAVLLARQARAPMALVHVVNRAQSVDAIATAAMSAHALLGEMSRTLRSVDGLESRVVVKIDEASAGIVAAAAETRAAMIVIGPHRKRLSAAFTGSLAERLIRRAHVPVLVALRTPSSQYERTVVALDFHDASKNAVAAARKLGLFAHGTVSAVHVLDASVREPLQAPLARQAAIDADARRAWRETRHDLHALVRGMGLSVHRLRLAAQAGSVARSLLDCAGQAAANLIVIGTRNRDRLGFERLLAGSVAQELMRAAPRDVLVVPEDAVA